MFEYSYQMLSQNNKKCVLTWSEVTIFLFLIMVFSCLRSLFSSGLLVFSFQQVIMHCVRVFWLIFYNHLEPNSLDISISFAIGMGNWCSTPIVQSYELRFRLISWTRDWRNEEVEYPLWTTETTVKESISNYIRL